MKAKVFHARLDQNGRMYDPRFDGERVLTPEHYVLVADVALPDDTRVEVARERAFERTNTIDREWWKNDDVVPIVFPTRSTSVGDVVVVNDRAFRVEGIGWTEITAPC